MDAAEEFGAHLVTAGKGRPVIVFAAGFASSPAHLALAERFRVIVADGAALSPRALGEAAATWAAEEGLDEVGLVGAGALAAAALWAARVAGDRASAIVLVSPDLPLGDGIDDDDQAALRPLLTEVTTPKAVLIGTLDAGQPRNAAALYRTRLSRANVVLVYDAGADIAADRPDAFARVAGDFLDRQGRFAFMAGTLALA
jgi:pimeloyl-ACP methyl ester carboxylesterase